MLIYLYIITHFDNLNYYIILNLVLVDDDIVVWNTDNEIYSVIKASTGTNTGTRKDTVTIGWVKDGGLWYYLKPSGDMATGWINDGGSWYYLNASGAMLSYFFRSSIKIL